MEFETGKKSNNRQQYRRKPVHESDAALEMGKTQPQDIEFEEAVLGAIMLEKDAYSEVSDLLTPESFYLRANQLIYEAIRDLGAQQLPIDLLTVTQQLRSNGHLDEVGGAVHISELTSRVASAANIEYHAQIVAHFSGHAVQVALKTAGGLLHFLPHAAQFIELGNLTDFCLQAIDIALQTPQQSACRARYARQLFRAYNQHGYKAHNRQLGNTQIKHAQLSIRA